MDYLRIGVAGIGFLACLLILGVHIAVALAVTGVAGVVAMTGIVPGASLLATSFYYKIANYSLVTIPLFVLMGLLAAGGEISNRLYDAATIWMGKVRAGMGIATVIACAGFGAVCGSSLVTASVFAKVSAPHMRSHGYNKNLAYGICASAGMIGMLIPPSVLAVVYAFVSGESVGKLQIAGVGPGLLLTILYSAGLLVLGFLKPQLMLVSAQSTAPSWKRRFQSLLPTWPVVVVAAVIFGGIFRGVFSPTEAASVAAFVMLVLFLVIRRHDARKEMASAFTDAATISAMIFAILAGAAVFSYFLILSGVTPKVTGFVLGLGLNNTSLIIAIIVLYLILGCFLDSISMVAITVPVLHPVIVQLGIDPIWYSMVAIFAMEIGLITPPVGLNVFGTQAVAEPDVTVENVFAGSVPFFLLALVALIILLVCPAIATYLPDIAIPR
jgi:C4-dicarboxylate transporter DctM subunit